MTVEPVEQLAVGLVRLPGGTPRGDRTWARALVVRHARAARLALIDIYELDDDETRRAEVLERLATRVPTSSVRVLVTDGVPAELATRLAEQLGLHHEPVITGR
jgi:hypothetical protein